jgi:hypothetical protein
MTKKQINESIATACGWHYVDGWHHEDGREGLPDFAGDANAVPEFERALPIDGFRNREHYLARLVDLANKDGFSFAAETWAIRHATPRQCAEAFLKTIGKWVDDEPPK